MWGPVVALLAVWIAMLKIHQLLCEELGLLLGVVIFRMAMEPSFPQSCRMMQPAEEEGSSSSGEGSGSDDEVGALGAEIDPRVLQCGLSKVPKVCAYWDRVTAGAEVGHDMTCTRSLTRHSQPHSLRASSLNRSAGRGGHGY